MSRENQSNMNHITGILNSGKLHVRVNIDFAAPMLHLNRKYYQHSHFLRPSFLDTTTTILIDLNRPKAGSYQISKKAGST